MEFDIHLSDKMDCLVNAIAVIYRNQSLVMLKAGDDNKAILNAKHSLSYLSTAKVDYYIAVWYTYNMHK